MAPEYGDHRGPKSTAVLRSRPELHRDLKLAGKLRLTLDQFYALPEAEEWIADWEIEQETCRFHGGPVSECDDDKRDWFPQLTICQPTMQLGMAKRRFLRLHEGTPWHDGTMTVWMKEPSDLTPFHIDDGVSIFLTPVDHGLGGDFLKQGVKSPIEPSE